MKTRTEYMDESNHNYPPKNKTDLIHLVEDCSQYNQDIRNLFDILFEIEYRVVSTKGTGIIKGFKHDRTTGEMKINIKTNSERVTIKLKEILKLEPTDSVSLYP